MMRTRMALLPLLAVTLMAAPAHAKGPRMPKAADDSATVRRAIDAGNARYVEAWKRGDAKLFASGFADDGAELHPGQPMVYGRDAIKEHMERVFKVVRMQDGTIDTRDVFIIGDTAYETGRWRFTFVSEGRPAEPDSGAYVEVWKRERPGVWLMWRDIGVPRQ